MASADWMTPQHPRWDEFCERLEGPEGCDFQKVGADTRWSCEGGTEKPRATRILTAMGLSAEDVQWSLAYFEELGGFCDCEILFNVDPAVREDGQ